MGKRQPGVAEIGNQIGNAERDEVGRQGAEPEVEHVEHHQPDAQMGERGGDSDDEEAEKLVNGGAMSRQSHRAAPMSGWTA